MIVNPPHGHFREDHLAHVVGEMQTRGRPVLRAYYDAEAGMWHAREGTHRLRAAKILGFAPILIPVPWPRSRASLARARFRAVRNAHTFEAGSW